MHCHHEKTIVIDDRIAFVGGIDLTSEDGDRFDSSHHPARGGVGWHDVATRIEGPAVADVAEHFSMRWHETTGERLAPVIPPSRPALSSCRSSERSRRRSTTRCRRATSGSSSRTSAPFAPPGSSSTSRTSSSGRRRSLRSSPRRSRIRRRPTSGCSCCCRQSRTPAPTTRAGCSPSSSRPIGPRAGLRLDAVCPLRPSRRPDLRPREGGDRRRRLAHGRLREPERALALQRHRDEHRHPRSGARARDAPPALVGAPRTTGRGALDRAPVDVIDTIWKPISREQFEHRKAGSPLTHRLVCLPQVSKRSSRLLGPVTGLVVDG